MLILSTELVILNNGNGGCDYVCYGICTGRREYTASFG